MLFSITRYIEISVCVRVCVCEITVIRGLTWGMQSTLSALSPARLSSLWPFPHTGHVIYSYGPQLWWYRANSWPRSVKFHTHSRGQEEWSKRKGEQMRRYVRSCKTKEGKGDIKTSWISKFTLMATNREERQKPTRVVFRSRILGCEVLHCLKSLNGCCHGTPTGIEG